MSHKSVQSVIAEAPDVVARWKHQGLSDQELDTYEWFVEQLKAPGTRMCGSLSCVHEREGPYCQMAGACLFKPASGVHLGRPFDNGLCVDCSIESMRNSVFAANPKPLCNSGS